MSVIDTLVFDRVPGASYGHEDMNRVADAMEHVAARLQACGCAIEVSPERFSREDMPTESILAHYLEQLRIIRSELAVFITTPPVPGVSSERPYMTVQEANDIEKILVDVDQLITNMIAAYYYSGELYGGEV